MELVTGLVGDATGNEMFTFDCLRDEGELWIVASWYESLDGKSRTPAIAIRVNQPDPQAMERSAHQLLLQPIAKAVLFGQIDTHEGERFAVLRDEQAESRFGWLPVRTLS